MDMHVHTTASDGAFSPSEAVFSARDNRIDVLAIADHDTVDGVKQAIPFARGTNVCLVPAVELSAEHDLEIHILGYGIDPYHPKLESSLYNLRESRTRRTSEILVKLHGLGIDLQEEDIHLQDYEGASQGRPHIAAALVEKGYVSTAAEAFERYLSKGRPAYIPKLRFPIKKCISLICEAGGKSVLAHPKDTGLPDWLLEPLMKEMIQYGLWGMEVFHPSHKGFEQRYLAMAKRLGLFITAGSDQHNSAPLAGYNTNPHDPLFDSVRFLAGI
ncbi:MAG: PHP domain-containing protein [Christensenellales bacterium]